MNDKPTYAELEQQVAELSRKYQDSRKKEDALNAFFDQSLVMLFIADLRTNLLVRVNDEVVRITGRSLENLLSIPFIEFIHPDDREKSIKILSQLGEGKSVVGFENRHLTHDGETLYLEWSAVPDPDRNLIYAMAQDITERKRAEDEREKLQSQLRQAQKMEAVGRLAGGIAHDFNNMLSVILGRTDLLLNQTGQDQQIRTGLLQIKNAGVRSADLIRQLLAFARKQTVTPRLLDLNKTLGGMTGMLQRLIGEDIELIFIPGEKLWSVKIDPGQIDQLLANLCVNARDAIRDVGKITIETENIFFDDTYCRVHEGFKPGGFVMLAVSDNGCGMDAKTLDNIFEPYYTTKEVGKGTGLGLATVYGTVKQNQGFINVYSEPGEGTTFKIYLPRHMTKQENITDKVPERPAEYGNETILLVEDEPSLLEITTLMLEKLGYSVIGASNPGEAIELARNYTDEIHLLITDVIMPDMNGRDLAKNILSHYPKSKCLFMSGYTANVIAHHGVLDEGVNFIQKPFSIKALGAKLKGVLE